MKLIWLGALLAGGLIGLTTNATPAPSPWEKPAAEMAGQIAEILGPGQAQLTIRNLSTIPNKEIPAIQRLLEQDLKTLGVLVSGAESANIVHMTLSENQRERLWVAEVIEGNETRVAMVQLGPIPLRPAPAAGGITLLSQRMLSSQEPVLAILETPSGMVVLKPENVVIYAHASEGWREKQRASIYLKRALAHDLRGALLGYASGERFEAWLPGVHCSGSITAMQQPTDWKIECQDSDDPWALTQPPLELTDFGSSTDGANAKITPISAFYNSARNYFSGVLMPGPQAGLPPFYTLAIIPRSSEGAALLVGGIDGKVQVLENGSLQPVSGARDWGSDFAALHSGCGAGTQIIASGSGEATKDSLRAYELPAHEAIPASAALAMDGTVTALWTAPDGKSIFAVVRSATNEFEVDRVTASCN